MSRARTRPSTPSAQAAGPSIRRVSGSLVEAAPLPNASLYELVAVGERDLLGEVVRMDGEVATIQVYEETQGLRVGEPVTGTGLPLAARLGPGLLGSVLDGVGRPLRAIAASGDIFVRPGTRADTLDRARTWRFEARRARGDAVRGGDVLGVVEERPGFEHRVLVPPDVEGVLAEISSGDVTVDEAVARLADGTPLSLAQSWPVRRPRPSAERLPAARPYVTGQRVFDLLFPVAEGGSVALPGGFGTGKTVVEQSLAKFGDADVVVFIGCGERGNEIAEVLDEFPALEDPRTGRALMERTVLVVNTSNMPVAAREASIYLGMTIGEYYRDMGYRVAVMADSVSRWAEALRELGARLQEMPGEEGYPTYLANRLGRFCERAGRVAASGSPERELEDIAALIGRDALQDRERFLLESASLFREVVLQQNAFNPVDATSGLPKTQALARLAYATYEAGASALDRGRALESIPLQALRTALLELRHAPEDGWRDLATDVEQQIARVAPAPGEAAPRLEAKP